MPEKIIKNSLDALSLSAEAEAHSTEKSHDIEKPFGHCQCRKEVSSGVENSWWL